MLGNTWRGRNDTARFSDDRAAGPVCGSQRRRAPLWACSFSALAQFRCGRAVPDSRTGVRRPVDVLQAGAPCDGGAPVRGGLRACLLDFAPGRAMPISAKRTGCRPRIVKPENMQVFQRLFMSGPGASRANDFVTKRRSGFGQQTGGGGAKKGCSRRAAECWPPTSCQSRSSVCPFRGSLKGPPRHLRGSP